MKLIVHHQSQYHYSKSVILSPHLIRLHPAAHSPCAIHQYALTIGPDTHFIHWQQDPSGNTLARVVFPNPVKTLSVAVSLEIDFQPINPFNFFLEEEALYYPFQYNETSKAALLPYLSLPTLTPLFTIWLNSIDKAPKRTIDFMIDLNQRVQQTISYTLRHEAGIQSSEDTLAKQSGSCRDMSVLLMESLRYFGLAARFVSGYLIQLANDTRPENHLALHAWVEVYLPGAGWIGLDPTSGLLTSEQHIPLYCTFEPSDAAPIEGTCSPCDVTFDVHMSVAPVDEKPAISEMKNNTLNQVANSIDEKIQACDIRLTSGGEPTFTKINTTAAEWITAAMGDEKRMLAEKLLLQLKNKFSANGLLHFGQGKHYPGEEYPRWALNCFWRKDNEPIWQNPNLLAKTTTTPLTFEHAQHFMRTLQQELQLPVENALEAFEDPLELIRRQNNQEPAHTLNAAGDGTIESLAEAIDDTALSPCGLILPLHWDFSHHSWHSPLWKFRRNKLFLTYGDTAIGYRLPLDTLIKHRPNSVEWPPERSPLESLSALPTYAQLKEQDLSSLSAQNHLPTPWECTALGVSIKQNRLYVFMPPLAYVEYYLSLITHIEAAAAIIQLPVFIEGYEPPMDPRLEKFSITPDPGVIEINLHPAENYAKLSQIMQTVYKEAETLELTPTKYMMNGRTIAAGGGNHIVLGGITPQDSPFLRNPAVLRSIITYFQHHPSLAYLFSGLFIGPTCQAPRIDESRDDMLHELETAFTTLPHDKEDNPYWLIDRMLRNIMVDVTGNTHRAEICLDKLYSPDHMNGRLGLVEFRAFEMPETAELNVLQHLLVRAILLRCWQTPYTGRLIRWKTALHDKFMLPYYVWHDFADVIYDLQQHDIPLQLDWYQPLFDFRFPEIGTAMVGDIQLKLRFAAEPWPILGEQVLSGATSRPVDSATERLQLEVIGELSERYCILCNGVRLPLHPTTQTQHSIAGIRFKAWDLIHTLHPQLPAEKTLTFEVVDCKTQRVIGGCRYHVADPNGKVYDFLPINAHDAASRRQRLFDTTVSLREIMEIPQAVVDEEYRYTVDLRRKAHLLSF